MIRRVQTGQQAPALTLAGLPPGTPTTAPLTVVQLYPSLNQIGMVPADALITSDGAEVYATGPGRWGQLMAAQVRPT